jgi:aspartate/methionine/tyrosine aminotransferase
VLSIDRLEKLAGLGPAIISDEIYQGLTYTGRAPSILEITDQAFVLNGFSKLYAMTGWRLGYLIAPRRFIREIQKLAQNLYICAGSIVQWAGLAALKEAKSDVEAMVGTYDQRRKFMLKRLQEIGFGISFEPTGAFYILANAKKFSSDSYQLAFDILRQAKVGVTPGMDFGANGEGYIRFSYANSLDNIAEGLERIDRYLNG